MEETQRKIRYEERNERAFLKTSGWAVSSNQVSHARDVEYNDDVSQ